MTMSFGWGKMGLWKQAMEMSFLWKVAGLFLRDGAKVEVRMLLLHIERSQLRGSSIWLESLLDTS